MKKLLVVTPRIPDVSVLPNGLSADGKHMFDVTQVVEIPPETRAKKDLERKTPMVRDEFGIERSARVMSSTSDEVSIFNRRR